MAEWCPESPGESPSVILIQNLIQFECSSDTRPCRKGIVRYRFKDVQRHSAIDLVIAQAS